MPARRRASKRRTWAATTSCGSRPGTAWPCAIARWWSVRYRPSLASTAMFLSAARTSARSEEHTSELQSQSNLVCRLLLEKKKNKNAALDLVTRVRQYKHNWTVCADD